MPRVRLSFLLPIVALLVLELSCGGGGPPSATLTGTGTAEPSQTLSPADYNRAWEGDRAKPRFEGEIAGVKLVPAQRWFDSGGSRCASRSFEAPYYGPSIFSIRPEQLPNISLPEGFDETDIRVCKDGGVTALGYIGQSLVVLASGPHEWPVDAPADRVSSGPIGGREAVFVAPVVEGQSMDAMVIMLTDFGVVVVDRGGGRVDDVKQVASALRLNAVQMPQGKDTFSGTINRVRFYSTIRPGYEKTEDCPFDPMDPLPGTPTQLSADSPTAIEPTYLPAGTAPRHGPDQRRCGTRELTAQDYDSRGHGFTITRYTGEPAWYSMFSEDWFAAATAAGRSAVIVGPPQWARQDAGWTVIVAEDFGATVVVGDLERDEQVKIAEGLNR